MTRCYLYDRQKTAKSGRSFCLSGGTVLGHGTPLTRHVPDFGGSGVGQRGHSDPKGRLRFHDKRTFAAADTEVNTDT